MKIDLRGHGTSEGDPGGGYYSSDYVIDTLNAYQTAKKIPGVNPNNITLWGHSMAGNIVFRSLVINPDIRKAVIWAGAVYTYDDMRQYRITDTSYQPLPASSPTQIKRQQLTNTYGEFNNSSTFWRQVVPTNYLDGVTGRIEIHHSKNDNVVSIGYSRNLIKKLDGTQINHQLYEYNTGGHNLTGSTFTAAINRTIAFIKSF